MDFEGKTALITGAGNGIGKSAAIRFAEGGANVILVDINIDAVMETQKEIAHLGKEYLAIKVDMGSLEEIDQMVDQSTRRFESIDILFNNAGLTRHINFLDIEEEHWDQIHRVN